MPKYEIYHDSSGEWAALYEDGILVPDSVGDSYIATEKLFEKLGVEVHHNRDFLMGGSQRHHAAETTDMINVYVRSQEENKDRALALREKAKALLEEANMLEGK